MSFPADGAVVVHLPFLVSELPVKWICLQIMLPLQFFALHYGSFSQFILKITSLLIYLVIPSLHWLLYFNDHLF